MWFLKKKWSRWRIIRWGNGGRWWKTRTNFTPNKYDLLGIEENEEANIEVNRMEDTDNNEISSDEDVVEMVSVHEA